MALDLAEYVDCSVKAERNDFAHYSGQYAGNVGGNENEGPLGVARISLADVLRADKRFDHARTDCD